jgi:hypothetical protein
MCETNVIEHDNQQIRILDEGANQWETPRPKHQSQTSIPGVCRVCALLSTPESIPSLLLGISIGLSAAILYQSQVSRSQSARKERV